jgi:hypothetical protein
VELLDGSAEVAEVAERLRIRVLTTRWLRLEGRFPPALEVGRRVVRDAADLEVWIEAQREPEKRTRQGQREGPLDRGRGGLTCAEALEPPKGIEPLTYSLRVNRSGRLS